MFINLSKILLLFGFGFGQFPLRMINVNADCIVSIYENARQKVDSLFELLDDNLTWLDEIQEEARKAFQRYNSKI